MSEHPPHLQPRPGAFGRGRVPLPTGAEAAAFDARAVDPDSGTGSVPQVVLMENAGRAAAHLVHTLHPRGRIAVVVGSGNNGGDGVVLARTLHCWGRTVEILIAGARPDPDPLLHGWTVPSARIPTHGNGLEDALLRADVLVDGLLGTGIRGAPRKPQERTIQAMNAAGRPIVSLDIPSGVDADTGATPGGSVRAGATVAFGAPKRGSLLHPGRARSGRILAVEIGFPPWSDADASAFLATPGWARAQRPFRTPPTHKNAEGRLLLMVGSVGFGGAAVLAGRAALRSGIGFLRIAAPPELRALLQATVPEAVVVDASDASALSEAVEASDAVAMGSGMGLGPGVKERIGLVLATRGVRPVVMDADALNLLATGELPEWNPGADRGAADLLTPHPGEAGRLLACSAGEVTGALEAAARRIARTYGAAVLLKGAPSIVAPRDADAPLLFGTGGSSDLARAGMGDLLTGSTGAFLARGIAAPEAAGLALYFTARAGEIAGAGEALLPTDVIRWLAAAFAENLLDEGTGHTDLGRAGLMLDLPPSR